jgi:hypothetical protein
MTSDDDLLRMDLLDVVVPAMASPTHSRVGGLGDRLLAAVRDAGWRPPLERATPRSELRKIAVTTRCCPICGLDPVENE